MSTARSSAELGGKLLRFALYTLAFLAVLAATYAAHMRWFRVDVVFYSALFDAMLAVGLCFLLAWGLGGLRAFNRFERIQVLICWTLLGYMFAISVPTVIDRSLSFYILEKMQQHGGGLRRDRFEDLFTRGYAREHRLVDVRLTEQLESGTVTLQDGCVRLTPRGERLASFSRWFRANLLPRRRLLMGRYTDALTDPFRGNPVEPDEACRPAARDK